MVGIATTEFFIWRRRVLWAYTGAFIGIVVILMILVKMMVVWNHTALVEMEPDIMFRSYIVAVLGLLFWAFVRHFPDAINVMVNIGTIKGLPDFKLESFLKEGTIPNFDRKLVSDAIWETLQKFWKVLDHLMLFFLVMCVVFGTFPIENPAGVIGSLVILAGLGIWVMLFTKEHKWYRMVTFAIIMVCLGTMLYGTYMHFRPQDTTIEKVETILERSENARQEKIAKLLLEGARNGTTTAAEKQLIKSMSEAKNNRKVGGLVGVYKDLTYEKSLDKEIRDFRPTKLCGIRPGVRKFEIPGQEFPAFVNGSRYNIKTAIRIGGAFEGEKFTVESDGCAEVSFGFDQEFINTARPIPFILPAKVL